MGVGRADVTLLSTTGILLLVKLRYCLARYTDMWNYESYSGSGGAVISIMICSKYSSEDTIRSGIPPLLSIFLYDAKRGEDVMLHYVSANLF